MFVAALILLPYGGYSAEPELLSIGTPVTRTIAAGEIHRYRVTLKSPYARLQLVKKGIDLELLISNAEQDQVFKLADWRDREGWLTALLELDTTREYLLEIRPFGSVVPAGEYEISLESLPHSGPEARLRLDAERTIARADHVRYAQYLGQGGTIGEAIDLFEASRDLWHRVGLPREEARAAFSLAMIQQELDQMSEADEAYRASLALWTEADDQRGMAATLNQLGLVDWALGRPSEALKHYDEAHAIRERTGDAYFLAQIANNKGLVYSSLGQSRIAMKYLTEALEGWQGDAELRVPNATLRQDDYFQAQLAYFRVAGDLRGAGSALNNLARIHSTLGEYSEALDYYQNYRYLSDFLGDDQSAALATLNIGQVYFQMADHQEALDHLTMAAEFFEGKRGSTSELSLALDNLGKVHLQLGNNQRALDFFEQALVLRTREDDPKGRADTLQRLGEAYSALGQPGKAISYYEQSLELRQIAVSRYREALTLDQLGLAQASLGSFDDALKSHQKALEIHREAGNSRGEIESLVNLGRLLTSKQSPKDALEYLQEALTLSQQLGDRVWEAQALFELAKTELQLGRTQDALAHLDDALSAIDSLRGDLISPELRATYFATQLDVHRLYIDTLMQLARDGEPARREDAFIVAERAKQRTLLDYLANTGNTAANSDLELLKRRETLRRALDANEQERLWLGANPAMADQLADVDAKIRDITAKLERVEIQISGLQAPEQALSEQVDTVSQVPPLLGSDTVLLEYALGEDRSYVWVVGENLFDVAVLPPAPEIATRVREAFAGLKSLNPTGISEERKLLRELGELLLGPVAEHLGEKRLAIVPDGALHYLPFGVLGDPRAESEPSEITNTNEIVVLPSASGLMGLRHRSQPSESPENRIAVLADPVFSEEDPRVAQPQTNAAIALDEDLQRSAEQAGRSFMRLPATQYEAEIIQQLSGQREVLLLTGFEANREWLVNGSLNDYDVLHFATHGVVNPIHPGLSGVVLSAVDPDGHEQPAFVRALDLFYMQLGARLVVLSACETALGKEIRGEGLMGLTHGFFYAGASTVVSSLWKVPDRATAELMGHFYREMLQNGRAPAAALRQAQLKIRDQRRWRDPYFWGAFIVQGDWR